VGRRALPRLFAVVLASAPFVMLPGIRDFANLPQTAWLEIGIGALLLLYAETGPHAHGVAPLDAPLLAIGGWSLLSGLWAHNRYEWCEDVLLLTTILGVYFLASRVLQRHGDRQWLIAALVVAGGLLSAIGLAQYLFGLDVIPQVSPPAATLASRNVAASVVVVLFPVAAAAVIMATQTAAAIVPTITGVLLLWFAFHGSVRSAWVAVAIELVALTAVALRSTRAHRDRRRWGLLVFGIAALVMTVSLGPRGFSSPAAKIGRVAAQTIEGSTGQAQSVDAPDKTRSVSLRLAVWRDSLRLCAAHPLVGVGLGNFKVQFPAASQRTLADVKGRPFWVDYAHDEYLQAAAEGGLVGVALLVWLLLRLAPRVSSALRDPRDPTTLAAAIGLLGLAADSAFSFPMHRAVTAAIGAAFLGVLSAPVSSTHSSPPRALGATFASDVLVAALVLVVAWSGLRIAADRHLRGMTLASEAGDWDGAASHGTAARRLNPFRSLAWFPWASAEMERGHYGQAIALLDTIVHDYPYHASAWGNLAIAHLRTGESDEARRCFERVLTLRPGDAVAREQLRRLVSDITR
jgi:O-antigen ligase